MSNVAEIDSCCLPPILKAMVPITIPMQKAMEPSGWFLDTGTSLFKPRETILAAIKIIAFHPLVPRARYKNR